MNGWQGAERKQDAKACFFISCVVCMCAHFVLSDKSGSCNCFQAFRYSNFQMNDFFYLLIFFLLLLLYDMRFFLGFENNGNSLEMHCMTVCFVLFCELPWIFTRNGTQNSTTKFTSNEKCLFRVGVQCTKSSVFLCILIVIVRSFFFAVIKTIRFPECISLY